jgi:hypothetical protein
LIFIDPEYEPNVFGGGVVEESAARDEDEMEHDHEEMLCTNVDEF